MAKAAASIISLNMAKAAGDLVNDSRRPKPLKYLQTILHNSVFCTVCLEINDNLLHLNDSIFKGDWEGDALRLRDVLDEIFGSSDILFSEYICEPCKSSATNSYSFISKTKRTAETITKYLKHLEKETTDLAPRMIDNDWKNAMIVLEDPSCKETVKSKPKKQGMAPSHICDLCGKGFLRKQNWIRHLKQHNSLKSLEGPHWMSRPSMHEKYILAFKKQTLQKLEQMACVECGDKIKNTLPDLINKFHMSTQLHGRPERRIKRNTKTRKIVKRIKKTYECSICDKVLKKQKDLRAHVREHEKKPNFCLYCNKQFDSRQDYLDHVQTDEHRKKVPINIFSHHCVHCDYASNSVAMLEAHVNRIHLSVRPFKCEHCQNTYFDETQLKNHMKIHTGQVKPKVCDICGAHLAGPTALKKHRRLHTGERPYPCPHCDTKATCAATLKMHIMRKHMEATISCPLCSIKFHTMSNARQHVKKTHWKSKEKFDYTKLKGLEPKDYEFFRDKRKALL